MSEVKYHKMDELPGLPVPDRSVLAFDFLLQEYDAMYNYHGEWFYLQYGQGPSPSVPVKNYSHWREMPEPPPEEFR